MKVAQQNEQKYTAQRIKKNIPYYNHIQTIAICICSHI